MKKESKILLIGAVVILAILLAIPSGIILPAATKTDQQQTYGNYCYDWIDKTEWLAQSFAPSESGLLQVKLRLGRNTNALTGNFVVSIRSSLTGSDIISKSMAISQIYNSGYACGAPIDYYTQIYTFDLPATLTVNQQYFIVIRRTETALPNSDGNIFTGGGSVSTPGDYYKFGKWYVSSNSGASWSALDTTSKSYDLWFQTIASYVEPPANQPPVALFSYSPTNPVINERVFFDGINSYDTDGSIVNWIWDLDGDGKTDVSGVSSALLTYTAVGTFNVKLTVVDDDGASSSITKAVTVGGTPPAGQFTLTVNTQPSNCDVTVAGVGSKNSGTSGVATFTNLAQGWYQVTVSKTGYVTSQQNTYVSYNKAINVVLQQEITGYLLYITTTPPLCTVAVNGQTQTSDAEGVTSFTLPQGTYTVQVSKVGYTTRTETITITADTYFPITLTQIGTTYTLTITAISADDYTTPISNAVVTIGTESKTTDTAGVAEFELRPGTYNIGITKSGFEDYNTATTIVNMDKSISAFMIPTINGTPGFELIGVIVAIGVVFILLRRKTKK